MARGPFILTIDQGTTNTKVQLVAQSGAIVAQASRPVAIVFPRPGWVEQDPLALWESVVAAVRDCLRDVPTPHIAAVGLTNQRESITIWDRRTGQPVGPCISWQCRRTAPACAGLRQRGLDATIQQITGLAVDPLFSATKAAWLLNQIDQGRDRAASGALCLGTVDSWVLWNLTGGMVHATDTTNASRTQLLNLRTAAWDDDLLGIFDIPRACLADVRPSSGDFGRTAGAAGLPAGVPIRSVIGDSHAALFGHGAFEPGSTKATYGTGSSLMTLTPHKAGPIPSRHGLSSTIAWSRGHRTHYGLEGNITNTGGAVQWLGEMLGLPDPANAVARLAAGVTGAAGVFLVPAFAGLGAPYWDAGARGVIAGLTRGVTSAHLARAALDAIAHQVCDVLEAIDLDTAVPSGADSGPRRLLADGGASANGMLMQLQADLAGCDVVASTSPDLAARGAAWLAGLASGVWDSLESLSRLPREHTTFEPAMDEVVRQSARDGWRDAVARARSGS